MKAIFKYIAVAASAIALYSCQDEHSDINPANRPTASDIQVDFEMSDSNNVVFNLLNEGCTPIWYFDDGSQSTVNGLKKQFPIAGTYTVEIKMYNNNGICDGSITKELTFTKSFANFDKEIAKLTGGNDEIKVWQIAKDQKGHLACGDSPENPTGWWTAQPGDKDATGLYDDQLIFKKDGTYIYSPGKDGLSYINKGTTVFGQKETDEDYDVANEEIQGTWMFEYRNSELYLILSPHTILGYLTSDAQWEAPEFVVNQISDKKINLRWDGEGISWQYILAPLSQEPQIEEDAKWVYNAEGDLTKDAEYQTSTFYAHTDNWIEMTTNVLTNNNDGTWTYKLPDATDMQWQAQLAYVSQIVASANKKYDFHVKLRSTTDVEGVTIKVTDTKSDKLTLVEKRVDLEAGVEYEFIANGVEGQDIPVETKTNQDQSETTGAVKFVFDFGGNPANTEITLSEMILQESK
jgi:hypothetical protein